MEDNIVNRIARFIKKEGLLRSDNPVIVGLSGGADSVALLSILVRLGYQAIACHCNFQLRGEESSRDRNHAAAIAKSLHTPFEETAFDTTNYARDKGISIEMAARELRYLWFEQMRQRHNAQSIAVAHHRDDNAETLLLNLIRGTGLTGLTGMKPRNGHIVRPLLCVSRQEITAYLISQKLSFVTDSTNLEMLYTRNKIRLEIMPLLRQINPSVDDGLERTIGYLRESNLFYRAAIDEWKAKICTSERDRLHIDTTLLQTSPAPETLLFETISPFGFNASQTRDIITGLTALQAGKQYLSATHRIVTHRQGLILHALPNTMDSDTIALWHENESGEKNGLTLTYHPAEHFIIPRTPDTACFDADKIRFPLRLRHWRKGDRFRPFGMNGHKKLSDYFNDQKYSLVEKDEALLLCDHERILWIVGQRASNDARITHETSRILLIRASKQPCKKTKKC